MFVGQCLTGFGFDDQPVVDQQIGKVVTQYSTILTPDLKLALASGLTLLVLDKLLWMV